MAITQGVLFTEPLYTDTGLWCELAPGIDPARLAKLASRLGNLSPPEFKQAEKRLILDPDSLKSHLKRLFSFDQADYSHLPLVCRGRLESDNLNPDFD